MPRRRADQLSVDQEVAQLRDLDLRGLRARWASMTGRLAPPHLPRSLLFAMVAYRLQAERLGDLDPATLRLLDGIAAAPSGSTIGRLTQTYDQRRQELPAGAVLTREWNGQRHRVMAVENGFAWEGQIFPNLSAIAFAITSTKWNGPRFFGLRDKKPAGGSAS